MPNTSRICPLGCDEESRPRQLCRLLVGTVLALARSCGEGSTICSSRLLDEVAVYDQETRWDGQLPRAMFLDGPVAGAREFSTAVACLLSKYHLLSF
jgi:hypothetical protein